MLTDDYNTGINPIKTDILTINSKIDTLTTTLNTIGSGSGSGDSGSGGSGGGLNLIALTT